MTEGLIPEKAFDLMTPETVTPAVLYLVSQDAPTRTILAAGAGAFAVMKIVETDGVYLDESEQPLRELPLIGRRSQTLNPRCRRF